MRNFVQGGRIQPLNQSNQLKNVKDSLKSISALPYSIFLDFILLCSIWIWTVGIRSSICFLSFTLNMNLENAIGHQSLLHAALYIDHKYINIKT